MKEQLSVGAFVLDTRDPADFRDNHHRLAVNVGLDGRFAETTGMIAAYGVPIILVAEEGRENEAALRLARIGLDNVIGFTDTATLTAATNTPAVASPTIEVAEFDRRRVSETTLAVDVRNAGELAGGMVPGAVHIPLAELPLRLEELDEHLELLVYCASGWRSSVATSFLRTVGFTKIQELQGGFNQWAESNRQPA